MSNEMDSINDDIERLKAEALAERDENIKEEENNEEITEDTIDGINDATSNSSDSEDKDIESDKIEEDVSDKDEDKKQSTDSVDFEAIKTKVDGQEISLNTQEEVKTFIERQNRNIQPSKKSLVEEITSQGNILEADLKLLADIKAGNIGALNKLAKENKMDLADVDEYEGDYETQFEPDVLSEVDVVIQNIGANKELAPKFNEVVNNLPDEFLNAISTNAQDLVQFAGHVESGLAQELIPQAVKNAALNGGTLLENYIKLGEAKAAKAKETPTTKETKREVSEKEKNLRQRAGSDHDENKGGKTSDLSVDDIWNLSPEELSKLNLRDLA